MILAGYLVAHGRMNLVWALFLLELATVLGASVLYWVAARGGRPLVYRYGRYIHLDRDKLDRAEGWIQNHEGWAVFFGRIIPGLRNVSVVAAGVFGVPYHKWLPPFMIGSFLYILFFVFLGYWVGPRAIALIEGPRLSLRVAVTAIGFVALSAFLVLMYRRAAPVRHLAREPAPEVRKIETGLMAGVVATIEMGMGINVLLYALAALGVRWPERTLLTFFDRAAAAYGDEHSVRFAVTLIAALLVGNLLCAVVYAHLGVRLPGPPWMRGLLFSGLPLALSTLVLLPLLGAGPLGLGLDAGPIPVLGEALRNALFGICLATSYSLFRIARQRPARAATLHLDAEPPAVDGASSASPAHHLP
jgi:membrane protein DedA with SNARE-associated domain